MADPGFGRRGGGGDPWVTYVTGMTTWRSYKTADENKIDRRAVWSLHDKGHASKVFVPV